jgi:RRXRR protein
MLQPFVPVISASGKRLMPTTNRTADRLLAKGRAIRRFDRGLFYIVLLDREDGYTQPVAVGIDPGSKKEALTVQSAQHTFLNVQADAVTWVKEHIETRRTMRRGRRYRKTPYRANRKNRARGGIPPSTKARWGLKVRIVRWLARSYPITTIVIEDVAAVTKAGKRRWNVWFSPLEVGKAWCYEELERIAPVLPVPGHQTKALRDQAGLRKSRNKLSDAWNAHCVDSFILASYAVGGPSNPEHTHVLYLVPLRFHRRQLHRLQPEKGGIRKPYGGTISLGLKRGSWVQHPKYGIAYIGGTTNGRISLHAMQTGKRLTQNAKIEDCQFLCTASWRMRAKAG